MVHFHAAFEILTAVEATPRLNVQQNGPVRLQDATLRPKQKAAQVGQLAKLIDVELLHKPHPRSLNKITQKAVEGPEAEGHARLQRDRLSTAHVVVQELQLLRADGL